MRLWKAWWIVGVLFAFVLLFVISENEWIWSSWWIVAVLSTCIFLFVIGENELAIRYGIGVRRKGERYFRGGDYLAGSILVRIRFKDTLFPAIPRFGLLLSDSQLWIADVDERKKVIPLSGLTHVRCETANDMQGRVAQGMELIHPPSFARGLKMSLMASGRKPSEYRRYLVLKWVEDKEEKEEGFLILDFWGGARRERQMWQAYDAIKAAKEKVASAGLP